LSDTSVYFFSRNNEWVWLKNVPLALMIRFIFQRVLYEMSSFGFFCLLAGNWRPLLKGKWSALLGVPVVLKKRREVQRLCRISHKEIQRDLMPISAYLRKRLAASKARDTHGIEGKA
jgi:hypothetical protein